MPQLKAAQELLFTSNDGGVKALNLVHVNLVDV